jgi:hypothetical protein
MMNDIDDQREKGLALDWKMYLDRREWINDKYHDDQFSV